MQKNILGILKINLRCTRHLTMEGFDYTLKLDLQPKKILHKVFRSTFLATSNHLIFFIKLHLTLNKPLII